MNSHPKPDEWMTFLYGEESPSRHSELDAHLRDCTACRRQVEAWRGSMAALDAWETPKPARGRAPTTFARWAAAAVIVLGIGFALGRTTSTTTSELRSMQAGLRDEMQAGLKTARAEFALALQQERTELLQTIDAAAAQAATEETRQLLAQFAKGINERSEADHGAYLAALKAIEEQRAVDFAVLRRDLDTVAVNADNGLSRAQEQLMELATLAQPTDN